MGKQRETTAHLFGSHDVRPHFLHLPELQLLPPNMQANYRINTFRRTLRHHVLVQNFQCCTKDVSGHHCIACICRGPSRKLRPLSMLRKGSKKHRTCDDVCLAVSHCSRFPTVEPHHTSGRWGSLIGTEGDLVNSTPQWRSGLLQVIDDNAVCCLRSAGAKGPWWPRNCCTSMTLLG